MLTQTFSDRYAAARQLMVDTQLRARGIQDERVLEAMARVPRHEFISRANQDEAYEDRPLPIGEGQTISQPYIVAITLEALQLGPSDRVLEVGTGSGYQAALLATLTDHVYSIERHASLARQAEETLRRLGFDNVTVLTGDGSAGLVHEAPFDAIAVAAAALLIPPPLFEQLREGGRMVIPVGPPSCQELQLIRKHDGHRVAAVLEGCRFVPLVTGNPDHED